ncbi:MAG: phenylacetate--CoA ligase family protein [Candidatus Liptonbacteria bacterium]|nr:phenylacetate--CoA ligase family protein [Candidatus Liptonbacteria bacterium]
MNSLDTIHSAEQILRFIKTKKDGFWSRERERRPLRLFHAAARRVPAYKDFLRKHKINPSKIKTFKDFQFVPPVSKKNYLRKYPLEKLCWDGTLKKPLVWTSTSGSTGDPFYFPRGEQLDWEYSVMAEMFLRNSSYESGGPVLIMICFGMGIWIGGLITYQAFEMATRRANYRASIVTPGINKPEIMNVLTRLAPQYKETIIVAYPPFLKDILDEATAKGINFRKLNVRLFSAAEAYTEKFREHITKKAGVKNLYLDTLNIYGTADIGAMAWETPISILIRRLAMRNVKFFNDVFGRIDKTPTLAQYNPLFISFEAVEGEIILTGNNALPLVRYSIGDHGGAFNFADVKEMLERHGVKLEKEGEKVGVARVIYKLPFVYVYERSDFSVVLSGANIYPEEIREALQHDSLEKFVTTKFTLRIKSDRSYTEYLEINIELKPKVKTRDLKKLEQNARDLVVATLLRRNSEYHAIHSGKIKGVVPKIVFWPYEHPLHFSRGIKQKWVKK